MVTTSKREDIVYRHIKTLSLEYENKIPINILKMELEIYDEYLKDILNVLNDKGLILHKNDSIELNKLDEEIVVEDNVGSGIAIEDNKTEEEFEELELNEKERKSLNIIENLIKEDKTVPRYLLEGNLLYGELKLSNFSMYHVLLSLENNNIIKMIKKVDGDYYKLLI
ncbi:MAG: hypothetical protein LBB45_02215 [Methanobrevibacter sp.]|jgi:hypothetical protein|nr:hypothetical protein [Candidatus Methanovirga basalitermitum]